MIIGDRFDIVLPLWHLCRRAMLIERMTALKETLEAAITRAVEKRRKPT